MQEERRARRRAVAGAPPRNRASIRCPRRLPAIDPSRFLAIIGAGDIALFDETFVLSTVICMMAVGIVISTLGYTVLYVAAGVLAVVGTVAFKLFLAGRDRVPERP